VVIGLERIGIDERTNYRFIEVVITVSDTWNWV